MKKQHLHSIYCVAIGSIMGFTILSGCGKTQEQVVAEQYYQQELGMDKTEAQDLAEEMYGEQTGAEKTEDASEEEAVQVQFELDPQVKNADPGAGIVQFDDMIFHLDGTMTVKEAVDIVMNSSLASELSYSYNEGNEVDWYKDEEIEFDLDGKSFLVLKCYNPDTEQKRVINECIVGAVCPTYALGGEKAFDFWLPTGICITDEDMTRDDLVGQLQAAGYGEVDLVKIISDTRALSESCYAVANEKDSANGSVDVCDLEVLYVSGTPVNDSYNYFRATIRYNEDGSLGYTYGFTGGKSLPVDQM